MVIFDLSIIAPNGMYAKYYPFGALSLSRPNLTTSNKKNARSEVLGYFRASIKVTNGMYAKYYPFGAFSFLRHICATLAKYFLSCDKCTSSCSQFAIPLLVTALYPSSPPRYIFGTTPKKTDKNLSNQQKCVTFVSWIVCSNCMRICAMGCALDK